MLRFIVAIVLVVIAIGALIYGAAARRNVKRLEEQEHQTRHGVSKLDDARLAASVGRGAGVICLALALLFGAWSVVRVVPANNVGIPVTFGEIGSPKQSGFTVVAPWTDITNISTRLQVSEFTAQEGEGDRERGDAVEIRTADEYELALDVNVRWSVVKEEADDLFRRVGSLDEIREKIVRPVAREAFRDIAVNFNAEQIYGSDREVYAGDVEVSIAEAFAAEGLTLVDINLREIGLTAQLRASIEAKTTAQEDAERAVIEQQEALTRADTARQTAEIDAEAAVIKAEGEGNARRVAAEAEADANRTIDASLTEELLELRQIEAYEQANTVYVPQGAEVLIGATAPAGN